MGKKNMSKAIDGMQSAFEAESKGKAEAQRMKKKLEADIAELEMCLEHANSTNLETQKSIKKYQTQIRDCQAKLEDEQRSKEVAREQLLVADRKAHAMQNALEEARSLLEQTDKNRRTAETELSDVNETLSEATVQNQSIAAAKRKMNLKCRLCMLTLMKCPLKPRFARIRLPRLWLMLPVLPMSSGLNKTWP